MLYFTSAIEYHVRFRKAREKRMLADMFAVSRCSTSTWKSFSPVVDPQCSNGPFNSTMIFRSIVAPFRNNFVTFFFKKVLLGL